MPDAVYESRSEKKMGIKAFPFLTDNGVKYTPVALSDDYK